MILSVEAHVEEAVVMAVLETVQMDALFAEEIVANDVQIVAVEDALRIVIAVALEET